ncbi:MAG: sorbosone dehydrogenase family protein, partial [Salinigranum sp.]
ADNGRFFVRFSAPPREGTPAGYDHTFVLAEFQIDPGADRVDPGSGRPILEIPEPQMNHNGGAVAFGPDGYLYVSVGDGGNANDQGPGHVRDWYDANAGGNGQDVTHNLLGSVLRIDVDSQSDGRAYGIPQDNPLVGKAGLDEHYAWGFRNPWRLSFDGPDLYVADVGQATYEEVDRVGKGGNYGWNVREGAHCFEASPCPTETPDGRPLTDPIVEYSHGGPGPNGVAVIGGYRYRGDALPGLRGRYVFADWQARGRLFVASPADSRRWPIDVIDVDARGDDAFGDYVLGFGRGAAGELYVLTSKRGRVEGSTGALHRLRSANG